ncbi:MAG: restriction endonuclease subunit S, partial [Euryarchaeota archaeon]|nr:restriction endonuclease subunit S [Euryarchaeota archaeon]MBV1767891.1 restriction endonuclease subunit S [Methanobacterium sp.]
PKEFISEEDYEDWMSRGMPKEGDIVITTEAPLGEVAQLDNKKIALAQRLITLRGKKEVLNNNFLKYILQSPLVQNGLEIRSTGTTVMGIRQSELKKVLLPIPNYTEQKRISDILINLDKKINLNHKMNQTLEEIGQAIFRHWFADFEFPDEDGNPYKSSGSEMVDSELGPIPQGWEVGIINDLCDSITNGGTPKRKEEEYWIDGIIPWYKTGELFDGPLIDSEEHITPEGLNNSSCKLWAPNTILIALYASPTVGRLGILKSTATSNQACSGLVAKKDVGYQYLFYNLLFKREELNSIAVGSAQQNISQDLVKNTKTIIPPSNLTIEFQSTIEPFFKQKTLFLKESLNLSQIRDSLLLKLMSGKIRVPLEGEL